MKINLYHYYERERGPFRNLSSLSREEARAVSRELKSNGDVFASRRQDDYMDIRRELEQRARELFLRKGGRPVLPYPHYMTLGECLWVKSWYREPGEVVISLEDFTPGTVSFTYGDLFPAMRFQDGREYRGQVYTTDEIPGLISRFGFPQEWNPAGEQGPERYIEAQIWDDAILKRYL